MRPPPKQENYSDYKNERTELFGKEHLQDYDIVCFQELFNLLNNRKQRMIEHGKKAGFAYHALSPNPTLGWSESVYTLTCGGLLTLSRYPIVK